MADSESNPAILVIGIVTAIVAIFFVGNIVACVSPPDPVVPPRRRERARHDRHSSSPRRHAAPRLGSRDDSRPSPTLSPSALDLSPPRRYSYAQKLYPPKPKKKMGAKKRAREKLKQGIAPAGE